MSIKTIIDNNEKELLKENWHAIEGANGICACGEEKGICNERLKNFLRSSQLKLLEAVKEEMKKEMNENNPYPKSIFPVIPDEKWKLISEILKKEGISLDLISGNLYRRGLEVACHDIIRFLNEIK